MYEVKENCSERSKVMDQWTVVLREDGSIFGRLCHPCFQKYVAGIEMPWQLGKQRPLSWPRARGQYRMALAVRRWFEGEVFVNGTLYRWYGASRDAGEITDMDGMGAGFRRTREPMKVFLIRHAVWSVRHRQEIKERL